MGNRKIIDEAFTKEVKALLEDGYLFHTSSFAGHQGEIAKVDMLKGNRLIRVLLLSFSERVGGKELNGIKLTVGVWDYVEHNLAHPPSHRENHLTCFHNEFLTEKTTCFYQLDSYQEAGTGWGTREEAVAANLLREKRRKYKQGPRAGWKPNPEKMDAAKKILLPLIRSVRGLKSVTRKDIDDICKIWYKPYGADTAEPRWICYVRGKRFDYTFSSGINYGGKWYVKKNDGTWYKIT